MKKFLKYLFFIVFVILFSMVVLDKAYTYVYENSLPRNKTQHILQLNDIKIDYIFLGSSRVENHIVTRLVEEKTGKRALNLGVQGGRLDDAFLMLKLLKNNNVSTEKVFIQVDYLFNFENPSTIVGTESLPYIRSNEIISEHNKNHPDFKQNYYFPFYRYCKNDFKLGFREFFNSIRQKKPRIDLTDGFNPINEIFSDNNPSLPGTIRYQNKNIEAINSFCKDNKIEVVYFCAPFCKDMKNIEYIDKLKLRIPTLIDFSREIMSNEFFKNCTHLNEKGAKLFTEKLIETCNL